MTQSTYSAVRVSASSAIINERVVSKPQLAAAAVDDGPVRLPKNTQIVRGVRDGIADDTTAIQAAHDAAVAASFSAVYFPAGTYKFTTLRWSPYIQAVSLGEVILQTETQNGPAIAISDQWGTHGSPYHLFHSRTKTFTGQFHLENTNGSNSAIALAIGGTTTRYYADEMSIDGLEIWRFHGAAIKLLNNAFLLSFQNCFLYQNNGPQVSVADPLTNTGENISFTNCVFGSSTGKLMSVNTNAVMDFNFFNCSFDYLGGLNDASMTAVHTNVNMTNSHLEWDTVAGPFIDLNNGISFNLVNPYLTSTLTSGWAEPFVGQVTGSSVLKVTNAHYVFAPAIPKLYDAATGDATLSLDYAPNYQGGSAPTTYVSYEHSSAIAFSGIEYRETTYTPAWSGTIGDGTLIGKYSRIGNRVDLSIKLVWGLTTTHPSVPQSFGVPYPGDSTYPSVGNWWASGYGAGSRTGTARIAPGGSVMRLYDNATAAIVTNAAPMAWANKDEINISLTYFLP